MREREVSKGKITRNEKRNREKENDNRKKVCRGRRMLFWNIAGVVNKDEEFWRYIGKFDFISMCETWMEEEGWRRLKGLLPKSHDWSCSFAERDKKRGRAKGGFIIGKIKGWGEEEGETSMKKEEGSLIPKIKDKKEKRSWRIISVYNTGRWEGIKEIIKENFVEGIEENLIVGGDFNIRIGEEGGIEEGGLGRSSKDKTIGNGGRDLLDLVGEIGGYILNGIARGDKSGEFTYVGPRGSSVIDYIIVNELGLEETCKFKIEDRMDSDHMPLVLDIGGSCGTKEEEGWYEEEAKERRSRIC